MTQFTPNDNSAAPPLSHRLRVLTRRKTLLFLLFATVLAAATPFVLGLPSLYRASATVLVESQVPEGFVQNVGGALDIRLQAIRQEALSRAHLTELIERFNLYPSLRGRVPMELLLGQLQKDIAIDLESTQAERPTTVAFKITYTGRDPQTVAAVANRLASFYISQNDNIRARQATRSTEVLQQELTDTKKRLDAQEGRVQSYLSSHMGRLPQQVDANLLALGRLNTQVQFNAEQQSKLMERRQELQKDLANLELTAVSATAAVSPNDPAVKLAAARRDLADLKSRFNDRYPDVRDKQAEVDRLEREVQSQRGPSTARSGVEAQRTTLSGSLKEVESKLDDLSRESRSLRSQIQNYEGRVESAPARGPEYDALTRDYASSRDAYDALLKKYDEARLAETLEHNQYGEEFRILDAAVPPPVPAGPNRERLLMVAAVLALTVAVVGTLLVDQLDTSFHSIDDLRAFTRVPVLATIPRIQTARDARIRLLRFAGGALAAVAMLAILGSGAFHYAHGSDQIARILLRVG